MCGPTLLVETVATAALIGLGHDPGQDRAFRTYGGLEMDERWLDGSAAGDELREVFALEMTTARIACVGCGATGEIGGQMAYVGEIGTVVRCAACDNVLIRVVRRDDGRGRYWLDLKGVQYLQIAEAS